MDLVCLKSFAEVVERGTIAAAAAAQGYTAPAVSQHVTKLEQHLGARLFDRANGRLVPTRAGTALAPIALDILDLEARGRAVVHEPPERPHVVIAGFASAIDTVLIPSLPALRQRATIEIVECEDVDALRDLGLGAVDLVLTQEYDGAAAERNRRFVYTPLVSDPLTLVLPPHMPDTTTIEQLRGADWLLNGRATRCAQATMRVLARHAVTPRVVGTIDDNATLLAFVAAGQGVTVIPARVLDHARSNVTVAAQDLHVTRTIHAVTRAATTSVLSPVLDLIRQEVVSARRHGARDPDVGFAVQMGNEHEPS